jgi:fido (protein-threonine AMPylation protein)
MARYEGQDPYIDPQTGLLRNSVNARWQEQLDRIEAETSSWRVAELERSPIPGRFDLAHLRAIHKTLFSDVYPWAGEVRSGKLAKDATVFAMPDRIDAAASDLFRQLARENHLRGLDADEFATRAAHYMGEINALHPFREGNGRTQRAFIGQLAGTAGYRIAWDRIGRDDMTQASIEAYRGDADRLARLIRDGLTRTNKRVSFATGEHNDADNPYNTGIPRNLPARSTSYSERLSRVLREIPRANAGRPPQYVALDPAHFPDPLFKALDAFERATGTRVEVIHGLAGEGVAPKLIGVSLSDGVLCVDERASNSHNYVIWDESRLNNGVTPHYSQVAT